MKEHKIRKIIICVIVLAVCAIPAVFMNSFFGYLPILAAVLGVAGSRIYLQLLKNRIDFEETSEFTNCVRGERIDFAVSLRNRSILYYPFINLELYISDFFGDDDSVASQIITLAPKETRNFPFDVQFDHIGTYSAGLRDICMKDMLGLFTWHLENPNEYQVIVKPKIYDIERLEVSASTTSQSDKMLIPNSIDSTDYSGVREYVIGDTIKNIHWKLSAHTPVYMTKIYESYTNTGVCIVLDFHSPEYERETLMNIFDAIIETGLSVHDYAIRHGLESVIRYYSSKGEKTQINNYEAENLHAMIADMPKIHTGHKRHDALEILTEEGNSIYSEGNIAYCTADLTPELCEKLVNIRNRKKNPMLFAVVPDNIEDVEKDRIKNPLMMLESAGIPYYVLDSAADLA